MCIRDRQSRRLFIPTVFSPNNDGENDRFYPSTNNPSIKFIKTFRIFDRWGELVFERFNVPVSTPTFGWDGIFNGQSAQQGVYVYYLEIEFIDGQLFDERGTVVLLR